MKNKIVMLAICAFTIFSSLNAQFLIDGDKDDFYNGLSSPENGLVLMPSACTLTDIGTSPDDDTDLSAKIWMGYDSDYLYFYLEVTDDVVTASNTERYLNDCIELKFDPNPEEGEGTGTSNMRLTALGEDTAEETSGVDNINGSGHLEDATNADYVPTANDYFRKLTDDGYVLEFRVPLDYINEPEDTRFMVSGEGSVFGMAINIGDNDSGTRDHVLQWSAGHTDAAHSEAAQLGSVTFMADNILKLEASSPRDAGIINANEQEWYFGSAATPVETVTEESEQLLSNYPNPFNSQTQIKFHLTQSEVASIEIYDITGKVVRHLSNNQFMEAGDHEISWDGKNDKGSKVSSGTYYCKFSTGSQTVVNKMLFIK